MVVKNEEKKLYIVQQLQNLDLDIPVHIDTSNKLYYP
jgi:hypothetical protein